MPALQLADVYEVLPLADVQSVVVKCRKPFKGVDLMDRTEKDFRDMFGEDYDKVISQMSAGEELSEDKQMEDRAKNASWADVVKELEIDETALPE